MDKIIALLGNPNTGKSTLFNALTGLRQHTGNWPGKTVTNAMGHCQFKDQGYVLVDLPGCYSLTAHSPEEEVARDFICQEKPDAIIVVCDAACLERNLNLVLQVLEISQNVVVCLNLMDEAKKKNIEVDIQKLSGLLGVPVVGTAARSKKGLDELMAAVGS
jgi:ferrous iron transport protein B